MRKYLKIEKARFFFNYSINIAFMKPNRNTDFSLAESRLASKIYEKCKHAENIPMLFGENNTSCREC